MSDLSPWSDYVAAIPQADPARATIIESWERCIQAQVNRHGAPSFRHVGARELARRLRRAARLVQAAAPLLRKLSEEMPGTTHVAYITDVDGVVLLSEGADAMRTRFGLLPGYDWSERQMGTNGAGTCLVTRRPVVVAGAAHFKDAFHDCTCTAAPIRGPDRLLAGALDVSSSVSEASPDRIELIISTAQAIEARLERISLDSAGE